MSILSKHFTFVNEQIAIQSGFAAKYAKQEWRAKLHATNVEKLTELAKDMGDADKLLDAPQHIGFPQSQKPNRFLIRPEELEGLPAELLAELSASTSDKSELAIYNTIKEAGGMASLDQILLGVYKKNGELSKRTALTSRLYRMQQKELVYPVPGKKGIYSTTEMSDEEAAKLFATDTSTANLF